MGSHLGAEVEIAKEIRNTCDRNGVELKLELSAPLLQKLALVYLDKFPDTISLLQSVGLLNAALSRQPNNEEIQEELIRTSSRILELAKVKNRKHSLLGISQEVLIKVRAMRNAANASLANLTNIPYSTPYAKVKEMEKRKVKEIEILQNQINKQYIEIMRFISKKCVKVLGSPPCEFTLVGLGNLARKDTTPYSDFKAIVVLKEGIQNSKKHLKALKYFRWYLTIFQVIILNMQETTLSKMEIPVLNNSLIRSANWFNDQHTISGISSDGFMSYAWKNQNWSLQGQENESLTYEAIKSVTDMVKMLTNDENLKSGYHLADVSFNFCFLAGDKKVYSSFSNTARETIIEGKRCQKYSDILQEKLSKELEVFKACGHMYMSSNYTRPKIKHSVEFSVPFFVSTVARLKSIENMSLFETVRALREMNFINDDASKEISFALAVSYEARLRESMDRDFQEGAKHLLGHKNNENTLISKLVELTGEHGIVRYFEIAILLQEITEGKVIERWNIDMSQKSYSKFHIFVLNFLNLHDFVHKRYQQALATIQNGSAEEKMLLHTQMIDTYFNTRQYEKTLELVEEVLSEFPEPICQKYFIYTHKGRCLYRLKNYQEALISFSRADVFRNVTKSKIAKTPNFDPNTVDVLVFCGLSHLHLERYNESLKYLGKALAYLNFYENFALLKCDCKSNMANCYFGLGEIERAKKKTNQALKLYRDMNAPAIKICNCHHMLGLCYMSEQRYKDALYHLRTDFTLRSRLVKEESNPNHLESVLTLIEVAASKLHEEDESLED